MKLILDKYKYQIILFLLFLISEIIVWPTGQFPLNDDWAYTKPVLLLGNEGKLDIGEWPAMTLATHILWGTMFIKIFGFSFFILRISTLVSSFIGIFYLYKLITRITNSDRAGLIASLTLLYCPFYFNLSNTFMTDVNFNTLLIITLYYSFSFFKNPGFIFLPLIFILSVALVLLRQYGITVPACFTFACLFLRHKKLLYTVLSVLITLLTCMIFHYYEDYLRSIMNPEAAYKFSGDVNVQDGTFFETLLRNSGLRWRQVMLTVLIYILPFSIVFFVPLFRRFKTTILLPISLISILTAFFVFRTTPFLSGNVFMNMSLGVETWYESLTTESPGIPHTYSSTFSVIIEIIKFLYSGILIMTIALLLIRKIRMDQRPQPHADPFIILTISLLLAYVFMLFITESYFDRYHIPAISIGLILISLSATHLTISWKAALLPLTFFAYISLAGTRDYFTVNTLRWQALHYLTNEKGVPSHLVNAGFEPAWWNEGKSTKWAYYLKTDRAEYLIQYRGEPKFKLMKEYPFQRYFPYKKDKINIFVREQSKEL